ncbi:MAG: EAL domain-containing protein [Candidatus Thiodiazotropha sp. (ex Dulcina madagascariensis)]|nr:EAL domain-containing protein [Candidatus Thiodiazotropha sp. (ex Dulcina madagascariensis)]MCU7928324.1 EAL domain-containing protein [Candidatus Thiodiazotropha sp. (ex Dulcina madagascariensis)]MCU7935912.1 EAL domain-containing protein [Candidatus Thiodiazotropha sp. (ex Dulcina madagascariensis)]
MKQNTIFRHLFIRMALILLGVNLIFSLILVPTYKSKLIKMIAVQGDTFANSTIAACAEALYTNDYSYVISYLIKVLKQTPDVEFVSLKSHQGPVLHISAKGWQMKEPHSNADQVIFSDEKTYLIEHKNIPGSEHAAFLFSKPISISGLDWGVFKMAMADDEYQELLISYFRNAMIFSLLLIAISLLLMHGSSLKLGQQLAKLRETALKLAQGNLSARAPTEAIGEINLLATTLNGMAESLGENIRNARRLARVVEDTNDAIALFDKDEQIIFVNPALKNITHQPDSFFAGMSLPELFNHLKIDYSKQLEVTAVLTHAQRLDWETDIAIQTSYRGQIHMTLRIEQFDAHEIDSGGFFVVLSDITRRKQLEHELETLAYIDKLTKLPNRRYFMDKLTEAVNEAESFETGLAIMFLDLDNFKVINDTLGHEVGDFVLSEAGWRIQSILRTDDTVCRLGGDEFTTILRGVKEKNEVIPIANQIIKQFEQTIFHNDRELRISTSIGIVLYPMDGISTKELVKNADTAMYAAKKGGKNAYRFFSEEMHHEMLDYLEIESALRKALTTSGLYLVYQPIIDIETRQIRRCEALLRWNDLERGHIPPGRFIPIAEQSGLIVALGEWVFNEVCKQIKSWDFEIDVSINISGNELIDSNFINRISDTLIEHDIPPHRLQLEFTEHVLVSKEGKNLALLNRLKRIGFQLAVDDFGTGFSSLSYLTELPIDVIKIDKSFISRLPGDRKTIAVVNSIISLAQSLDMSTIGEGAETKEQVDWLDEHGCSAIQGFYFHKPMTGADLRRLVYKTRSLPTPIKIVK